MKGSTIVESCSLFKPDLRSDTPHWCCILLVRVELVRVESVGLAQQSRRKVFAVRVVYADIFTGGGNENHHLVVGGVLQLLYDVVPRRMGNQCVEKGKHGISPLAAGHQLTGI